MHTRFRAKHPVSVIALNINRAALDTGHFTFGFFLQFNRKAFSLTVVQVHALEHARPILSFGAAGARLNFQIAVGRIHRLIKHPLEFQFFNRFF